jgi:hypothetical protein
VEPALRGLGFDVPVSVLNNFLRENDHTLVTAIQKTHNSPLRAPSAARSR